MLARPALGIRDPAPGIYQAPCNELGLVGLDSGELAVSQRVCAVSVGVEVFEFNVEARVDVDVTWA